MSTGGGKNTLDKLAASATSSLTSGLEFCRRVRMLRNRSFLADVIDKDVHQNRLLRQTYLLSHDVGI